MGAIGGYLAFHGHRADPALGDRLSNAMRSYGPAAGGSWTEGPVSLAWRSTGTVDACELDAQPCICPEGRFTLVWEGRLDNRAELAKALFPGDGAVPHLSDARLVLGAWRAWGAQAPARLLGDFGFAVWDQRERALTIVRDATGARPLYWTRTATGFAFATSDWALLGLPGVESTPYAGGVVHRFAPGLAPLDPAETDVTRTWYEALRLVRAGEMWRIDPTGAQRPSLHWQPVEGAFHRFASDRECQDAFLDVFGAAVRDRLRAPGPVSMLLSGGLDSASLVAQTRRERARSGGDALHAYSVIADDPSTCIETRCILDMAQSFGDRFHAVSLPSMHGVASLDDLLAETWPWAHPEDDDLRLDAVLFRAAARAGHAVVLHGTSGDLVNWAPSRYIGYWLRAGQWGRAWRECLGASARHTALGDRSARRLLIENAWSAWAPPALKRLARRGVGATRAMDTGLLHRSVVEAAGWGSAAQAEWAEANPRAWPSLQAWHRDALVFLHFGRTGVARVAGRHGIDVRDPWDDRRVVEFFLRLPLQWRVRDGWTKYLVRSTYAGDLSDAVRWRLGKEHLGLRVKQRILQASGDRLGALLADSGASCWNWLDRGRSQPLLQALQAGADAHLQLQAYNLLSFAAWLDRMDNIPAQAH